MSRRPREHVWFQCNYTSNSAICPVCRKNMMYMNSSDTWHTEHILRLSLGGTDTYPNLVPICCTCNLAMGKKCRSTFQYMHHLGFLTLDDAFILERKQHILCLNFDPYCEMQQKNGDRCANLKGGKNESYCWKHIRDELVPMDLSEY